MCFKLSDGSVIVFSKQLFCAVKYELQVVVNGLLFLGDKLPFHAAMYELAC